MAALFGPPGTEKRDRLVIRVTDFHKAYRDVVAVRALSFELAPGQILGLVGPNGAGKTTTLRTLSGIIPPTSGVLEVAGHDVVNDPVAAKAQLAYVPDDPRLFETLTVGEHLDFVATAYNVPDARTRADALLEQFELTEKRDTIAQELSRGMRQKAAICCAYLHNPKAIFFDEPHVGLDPRGIRTMTTSIIERARDGAAVICSSHLLSLVEGLCTHLLILHKGELLFFGSIEDAHAAYAGLSADTSLEEVFFRATEGPNSS